MGMVGMTLSSGTTTPRPREAAAARERWRRWRGARAARAADPRLQAAARPARGSSSRAQGAPRKAPALETLGTRELAALAGAAGRGVVERSELEGVARKLLQTRAALERVLGSKDLYGSVLVYVDTADLNALAATSRHCREAASEDLLWRARALRMLGRQFVPRVTLEVTRDRVLDALQTAHVRGFFRDNTRPPGASSHCWRGLLADCRRLKARRSDGFGSAVVIPRDDICPHHVLGVTHLLSICKDPACVADIFERFMALYASLDGDLRLRDNVGFCFRVPAGSSSSGSAGGSVESVSHKDFMDVVLECNLQLKDLIAYHQASQPTRGTSLVGTAGGSAQPP